MADNFNFQVADGINCVILSNLSLMETYQNILELDKSGYIDVEPSDLESSFGEIRYAVMATAIGDMPNRLSNAIDMIRESTSNICNSYLCNGHGKISEKLILFKILSSRHSEYPITGDELSYIYKYISDLPDTVEVKWSIADDPSLGEQVKLIFLTCF